MRSLPHHASILRMLPSCLRVRRGNVAVGAIRVVLTLAGKKVLRGGSPAGHLVHWCPRHYAESFWCEAMEPVRVTLLENL